MRFGFGFGAWTRVGLIVFSAPGTAHQTDSAVTPPAQIILIRHADKPSDPNDPHLSAAGAQRAERLASFILSNAVMTRFGLPAAIFVNRPTKDGDGQRSRETVASLAQRLQLPVQMPFLGKDYTALAQLILANPAFAGKTVLVCWNHSSIPQLAAALGVTPQPPKWKDNVFDRGYLISYEDGKVTLATFHYDRASRP